MKIVVAGCGKIGTTVIENLSLEGHDIVAIDTDYDAISEVNDTYDIMGVCGACTDYEILDEAGVSTADMFVAVTGSDELNMLSCHLAKKLGAHTTIARIRNPQYDEKSISFLKTHLDLNVALNPEQIVAKELYNIIKFPGADGIESFSRRQFELIHHRLKENSGFIGLNLIEIRKKYPGNYLIGTVERDEEVYIPGGNFVLKEGDKIGIIAPPQEVQKLFSQAGVFQRKARSVMILGASTTGYYLAKMLLAAGNPVKIIDKDKSRCEEFSALLNGATIIEGNGAEHELLIEEGINSTDAFVSLTGMDEENILISIYALNQEVPKVIAKVNRNELASMAEKLGIDTIVSPKKAVSDSISRYARAIENSVGSNVETLYKLMDGKAEALEFIVREDFAMQNVSLKDLKLKPGILIAGILRNRMPIVPSGKDFITAGDKVVVLASGMKLNDLSEVVE